MKYFAEEYSELCETSNIELFTKIVNGDDFCDFGTCAKVRLQDT